MDVQLGKEIVAIPEPLRRSARFNDGKASPVGSFVVGTVHNQASQGQPGQLFILAGGPSAPFDLVQVNDLPTHQPSVSMLLAQTLSCKGI